MAEITNKATTEVHVNGEQAKAEYAALKASVEQYKKAMNDADKTTKAGRKIHDNAAKELKKVQKELADFELKTLNTAEVLKRLDKASPKELKKTLAALSAELNSGKVARGSKEWDKLNASIRQVKTELHKVKTESDRVSPSISKVGDTLKSIPTKAFAFIAALTGLSYSLQKFRDDMMQLQESQASVKALTGLDDDSVEWLTRQAETLSTTMTDEGLRVRQSTDQILEAYKLVGSAKPDLLEDKEALAAVTQEALRLQAADGKIPLTDAVDALTKAMNQYGAESSEAARYTNVLAAGSKFGSAAIQAQATAIIKSGVAASSAKIPIEQLVGTIETLAEKGITDEVAGTGLKTFFLKLQTGASDTNPSVVGLSTALDNLSKKNLSAKQLQKQFGDESFNVASILINSKDKVDSYTAAVTDTNVAIEQSAINSATDAALKDQQRNQYKQLGIELAQRMNPAILKSEGLLLSVLSHTPQLLDSLRDCGPLVIKLTAIWAAYNLIQEKEIITKKLQLFWNDKIVASLKNVYTWMLRNPYTAVVVAIVAMYEALKVYNRELSESEKRSQRMASMTQAVSDRVKEETGALDAYLKIARDETKSKAERLVAIKNINDISPDYLGNLSLETINTRQAAAAVELYTKNLKAKFTIEQAQSRLSEIPKEEKAIIDKFPLEDLNIIEQIFFGAERMIDGFRGISAEQNATYRHYLDKQIEQIKELHLETDSLNKTIDAATAQMVKNATQAATVTPDPATPDPQTTEDEQKKALKAKLEAKELDFAKLRAQETTAYAVGLQDREQYNNRILALQKQELEAKQKLYTTGSKEYWELQNKIDEMTIAGREAAAKKSLEEVQKGHAATTRTTTGMYAEGLITKTAYDEAVIAEELRYLKALRDVHAEGSEEYARADATYQDALYADRISRREKATEKYKKLIADQAAADAKKEEDKKMATPEGREELKNEELSELDSVYAQGLISEEMYQAARSAIIQKWAAVEVTKEQEKREQIQQYAELAIAQLQTAMSAFSNFVKAQQNLEVGHVNKKYDRLIKAAGKNEKATTALEEQRESELAAIRNKYAQKEFSMNVISAIATTALSSLAAYNSAISAFPPPLNLAMAPIFAGIAAAAGMVQVATLKKQRDAAKEGYYDGGFTPSGAWNQEQGSVHSDEFVANRFAVRNPSLRRVFNVIDMAQRNNTVASLTPDQLAFAANPSAAYARSLIMPSAAASGSDYIPLLLSVINNSADAARAMTDRLERPFTTINTVHGPSGIKQALDRYDRLEANKSRQKP